MRNVRAQSAETVARVRRVLGPADPVGERDFTDAAQDAEGRAALAQIIATSPAEPAVPRRRRRRWTVVGVTVLVVGVAAASADATGLVPTGVVKGFMRADDSAAVYGRIQADRAKLLVQATTPQGDVAQWWEAPTTKGGWCAYDHWIVVGKNGKRHAENGSTACGVDRQTPSPDEKLYGGYTVVLNDRMGLAGRAAKPAVQVRLTFKDGRRMTVPVNANGYFMTIFDRAFATDTDESRLYPAKMAALDAAGRTLATAKP